MIQLTGQMMMDNNNQQQNQQIAHPLPLSYPAERNEPNISHTGTDGLVTAMNQTNLDNDDPAKRHRKTSGVDMDKG